MTLIKPKLGNKASHGGGEYLPERGVLPASGECAINGDQRRLAGGESLFDIQPVAAKLGCSQLLQKELDTVK